MCSVAVLGTLRYEHPPTSAMLAIAPGLRGCFWSFLTVESKAHFRFDELKNSRMRPPALLAVPIEVLVNVTCHLSLQDR